MKIIFIVKYEGNSKRFKNFETTVSAESKRAAVEQVYRDVLDENYFPQQDGTIQDCLENTIAEENDNVIEYDGGLFSAEEKKTFEHTLVDNVHR